MMALESARRRVQGVESAAPTSTVLALLCILLLTAALDGHEWARGTALEAGAPRDAVVSLSAVRLGAPDGKGGVEFRHPQAFKHLCGHAAAHVPRTRVAPANATTAEGEWCELRAAGAAAQTWIWLAYLPLYAAAGLSAVLALAERIPAAKNARLVLAAYGLTDAATAAALIGCWCDATRARRFTEIAAARRSRRLVSSALCRSRGCMRRGVESSARVCVPRGGCAGCAASPRAPHGSRLACARARPRRARAARRVSQGVRVARPLRRAGELRVPPARHARLGRALARSFLWRRAARAGGDHV
jgi:hypothetical protein